MFLPVSAWLLLAAIAAPVAYARTPAPAAGCLDARKVSEVRQPDVQTLAIITAEGGRFRVDLAGACPGATQPGAQLLAKDGWVCGLSDEYLRINDRLCPLAGLREIDTAEYARLARASDRTPAGVTTLDAVHVKGERRRGFSGSHSYCFNPSYLRAWSEDPQGVVVETSPLRAGGNRFYRVELANYCPELSESATIGFQSGVGIGLICGNVGDQIVAMRASPGLPGEDRARSTFVSRVSCKINAVYPLADSR